MFTVLRPYRKGARPESKVEMVRSGNGLRLTVSGADNIPVISQSSRDGVVIRKGDREWTIAR
jgi:hypothetical protein